MSPILSLVVPCYNSAAYMKRCLDSLIDPASPDIEIIIVNDGSTDDTARIADEYALEYPNHVRVIHKENGGHGSAINAGLRVARGTYFKVVDSDDWLDESAYHKVLTLLRGLFEDGKELDLLITNFVYEKQGKRVKRVVHYRRALPRNEMLNWEQVGSFWTWQYMLMHAMTYRTQLLRDANLHVPEKSFYVDNYFAFVPLPHVKRLQYLDVDMYRYFIGRSDQSVNEQVMIRRVDQQINVNMLMVRYLSEVRQRATLPVSLERYMTRYASLVTSVSSVLLMRDGTPESIAKKYKLWDDIEQLDSELAYNLRRPLVGNVVSRRGKSTEFAVRAGYRGSKLLVGFN